MGKNFLPFEDQNWNKIVEDAFAPDALVHAFSADYQKKRSKLMKKSTSGKFIRHRKGIAAVVAVAAAVVLVPTGVATGSRVYNAFVESTEEQQQNIDMDEKMQVITSDDMAAAGSEYTGVALPTENIAATEPAEYQQEQEEMVQEWANQEPEYAHMESMRFAQLGETVAYCDCDNGLLCHQGMTVTVDALNMQKNFDGITTDGINRAYDYSIFTDESGNVLNNERVLYKVGDGTSTQDEVCGTESMPITIIVAEMTYENTSSEVQEVCVCPNFVIVDEEKRLVRQCVFRGEEGTYITDTMDELFTDNLHFSFATAHETVKNNLVNVAPGEKVQVQLAFAVYDKYLEECDVYIAIDDDDETVIDVGSFYYTEDDAVTAIVDAEEDTAVMDEEAEWDNSEEIG